MNATDPTRKRPYNQIGPIGYFLTFHSYGTWLHGDDRGSVDRKTNNIPGTPVIEPNPELQQCERSLQKQPPVKFTHEQRKSIDSTIREVIGYNKWLLHALNVRTEHVHVVLSANKLPEPVMNRLKSWCTRRLREKNLLGNDIRPWSRHGSTRYLWAENDLRDVCNYVLNRQD